MRPAHSTRLLLAVLLVNASAMLFFRFFTSVDGPIHVLHASLLEWPWGTADHLAQGITYDRAALHDWFGHRILKVLLLFRTPLQAHDLFAALVCCAVVLSVVAYLRAQGTRIGLAIIWLAPLTFNLLLVIGLFHFLLGTAIAFGSVAWWKWHANAPGPRWSGLLMGLALAAYTHRSAPILLGILFLLTVFIGTRTTRTTPDFARRYAWAGALAIIGALVIGALRMGPTIQSAFTNIPETLPAFDPSNLLRPLFLLERSRITWLIPGIGLLLLIACTIGIRARWSLGRKLLWHDALLMLFGTLALLSWIYGTPIGQRVFIAERCQWLAMLALALWLAAIADSGQARITRWIGVAALCAMPLHMVRLVHAGTSFARLGSTHELMIEACGSLAPGSLVVPVITDPDPLLQHIEAYAAIAHDGIVVAPDEHLRLILPVVFERSAHWLHTEDRSWLMRRLHKGIPPEVDQVLFIGSDIDRAVSRPPWPDLLPDRFRRTFENGHAQIHTATRNGQ